MNVSSIRQYLEYWTDGVIYKEEFVNFCFGDAFFKNVDSITIEDLGYCDGSNGETKEYLVELSFNAPYEINDISSPAGITVDIAGAIYGDIPVSEDGFSEKFLVRFREPVGLAF